MSTHSAEVEGADESPRTGRCSARETPLQMRPRQLQGCAAWRSQSARAQRSHCLTRMPSACSRRIEQGGEVSAKDGKTPLCHRMRDARSDGGARSSGSDRARPLRSRRRSRGAAHSRSARTLTPSTAHRSTGSIPDRFLIRPTMMIAQVLRGARVSALLSPLLRARALPLQALSRGHCDGGVIPNAKTCVRVPVVEHRRGHRVRPLLVVAAFPYWC